MSSSDISSHGRLVVDKWTTWEDFESEFGAQVAVRTRIQEFWNNARGQWMLENQIQSSLEQDYDATVAEMIFVRTAYMTPEQITEYLLRWPGPPGEWRLV